MKKLWTVAKLTFQLPFRRGGGFFLLALLSGVSLFTFLVCRSDGVLINELQLRIRFSLLFSVSLLSLSLLWYACTSMRGDIDAKRMHLLTAYPIHRGLIYAGKWLGLLMFGAVSICAPLLVTGLSATVMVLRCKDPQQIAHVKSQYLRLAREIKPIIPDAEREAVSTYDEQRRSGKLTTEQLRNRQKTIDEIRKLIVRKQQLVPRNGSRPWRFELGTLPEGLKQVTLEYRFYSHKKKPITADWLVFDKNGTPYYRIRRADQPYQTHQLQIPASAIPGNGPMFVQFTGINNPDVIFYNRTGMKLFYRQGTWLRNLGAYLVTMLAHLGLVTAVGLTIASAFTLSVASFVSMILYIVAMSSDFFQRAIKTYRYDEEGGVLIKIGTVFTRVALFFITGIEPPSVVTPLSNGVVITSTNIGMQITRDAGSIILFPVKVLSSTLYNGAVGMGLDLFLGYSCYFAAVAGLGIWLLTRKELDRVH